MKLTDQHGIERNTHEEMEKVLLQHFQKIAEETSEDRYQFMQKFTQYIPTLVTKEDNFNLNRPVTEEEIEEAVKEMQNGKAPGSDGFNVDFFKACWRIVKQDTLEVVEDSRRFKKVLKALNESFIALIPKQEKATSPDRFRPIALCNVIYKIISKVIANRLKPLLPTLVSEEQMGYVEGRQILDNIIQAHETIHSLITNKKVGMIMQLDIAKAYDKVSWLYIISILKSYAFYHNWIKWIMVLVTTTSCSILLNGAPSKNFKISRGLKQGDPLSPFLFILMMEGLGRAMKAAKEEGRIYGLRLTHGGDTVTHQQFVDDTMFQGTPIVKEAKAFKQILSEFSRVAGTKVSLTKSNIFVFNTDISIQINLSRILGFQRESLPVKYLGVPLTDKPLHKDIWEPVLNKLKDKINKWTNIALNLAGRLVLTVAILQSIPIYMLYPIPAPASAMTNIRNIQRDFLWGKSEEKKKWALVAWDRV